MAKSGSKKSSHMMQLARRGARAQLEDLLHELDMLFELFPNLRDSFDPDELPVSFLLKRGSDRAERRAKAQAKRG